MSFFSRSILLFVACLGMLSNAVQARPSSSLWLAPVEQTPLDSESFWSVLQAHDRKRTMALDFDPYLEEKQLTQNEARHRLNRLVGTALLDRLNQEWQFLSYRWRFGSEQAQGISEEEESDIEQAEASGSAWSPDISYRLRARHIEMQTHFRYTKFRLQASFAGDHVVEIDQRLPESLVVFGASYHKNNQQTQLSLSRAIAPGLSGRVSQRQDQDHPSWYQVAELMFGQTF